MKDIILLLENEALVDGISLLISVIVPIFMLIFVYEYEQDYMFQYSGATGEEGRKYICHS